MNFGAEIEKRVYWVNCEHGTFKKKNKKKIRSKSSTYTMYVNHLKFINSNHTSHFMWSKNNTASIFYSEIEAWLYEEKNNNDSADFECALWLKNNSFCFTCFYRGSLSIVENVNVWRKLVGAFSCSCSQAQEREKKCKCFFNFR